MKNLKKIFMLLLLAAPALSHAQSGSYTVTGKVGERFPATAKAYLNTYDGTNNIHLDSSVVKDGKFAFKGYAKKPELAILLIMKKGNGWPTNPPAYITMFVEPGNITVISADSLINAKVNGGILNEKNNKFQSVLKPLQLKQDTGFMGTRKVYKNASKEQAASKSFRDSMMMVLNKIVAPVNNTIISYIKDNPDDLFSLFLIKRYYYILGGEEEQIHLFDSLSANVKATPSGQEYGAVIAKIRSTAIGALAPDFTLADTTGKSISLHDFKGKYVLVDFWASWCVPCRGENPNVAKAYAKYQSKGLEILGVSLDNIKARASWIKAMNDDHISWTQVSDLQGFDNAAAKLYHIQSIPQNFLIGPDGHIVAKELRGEELQAKLADILGK